MDIWGRRTKSTWRFICGVVAIAMIVGVTPVYGDVAGRGAGAAVAPPTALTGAMPMPGTQEQELTNITAPAPYNVFEFVVTCMACHGGTIDQQVGHGGNWAGTNMASAAHDPVFRANELIVNAAIRDAAGGEDGAGNLCMKCHSPNGWLSGRYNPYMNGDAQAGNMIQSPLLSTDAEGVMCEMCHRAMGNVEMQSVPGTTFPSNDAAFNLMTGVQDWPHSGGAYPEGPLAGDPLGDATLQFNDGMTYSGKYQGSSEITYSDVPHAIDTTSPTPYTGQAYAVYPTAWPAALKPLVPAGFPQFNALGQEYTWNPDGSLPPHFEKQIGPPLDGSGNPDYMNQAISLEHPTTDTNGYTTTSELCGSCHDVTVPLEGSGMPEQRTYTEWQYSDFGTDLSGDGVVGRTADSLAVADGDKRCQDCHMPSMKHEYDDTVAWGLNVDPELAGYFPAGFGKDRNPQGGTAFHKFAGANRDLPAMMKLLYPEVDLEVIGAETNDDPRIFPGMMSDRSTMFDRAKRNTEVSLRDAVSVDIVSGPTEVSPGNYEVQVKVTNNTGHKVPSGYPDGRRMWVEFEAKDGTQTVFHSGEYDQATATLSDNRSLSDQITSADQAMIYEKVTGSDADSDGEFVESNDLLNTRVIFDNRIPPKGFDKAKYDEAGADFVTYTDGAGTGVTPVTDMNRFTHGPSDDNFDVITYAFTAPAGQTLSAVATVHYQSHTREFMEHLRANMPSNTPRPEGPPWLYTPNYPLTPKYLSESISGFATMTALGGEPLNDDWGGIAYASWMLTGKGAPFALDTAQSGVTTPPDAPALTVDMAPARPVLDTALGNPFALLLSWPSATGVDYYEVWIRYGKDATGVTASWDRIAVLPGNQTTYLAQGLNVAKTYGFRVVAHNSAGSAASADVAGKTSDLLPNPPAALMVFGTTANTVTLTWQDMSDNETGFVVQRQEVDAGGPVGPFETVAMPTSAECMTNPGATGMARWTDTDPALKAGTTYNYQVAAYNASGMSIYTVPAVQAVTKSWPIGPATLSTTLSNYYWVNLSWPPATGIVTGYSIYRTSNPLLGWGSPIATTTALAYTDKTAAQKTTYYYKVAAFNGGGEDPAGATARITTLIQPIKAPSNLRVRWVWGRSIKLAWRDNSNNETLFRLYRRQAGTTRWVIANDYPANSWTGSTAGPRRLTGYYYRLQARNQYTGSTYSNTIYVRTK